MERHPEAIETVIFHFVGKCVLPRTRLPPVVCDCLSCRHSPSCLNMQIPADKASHENCEEAREWDRKNGLNPDMRIFYPKKKNALNIVVFKNSKQA